MAKSAKKSARKFASSGQLQKTIQARRKHQQIKKKFEKKSAGKDGAKSKGPRTPRTKHDAEDEDEMSEQGESHKLNGMSVDDFLGGGFMASSDEDEESQATSELDPESDGTEGDEDEDDASFASIDDFEDEGLMHIQELSKLAEQDPEFYKYLQEHDAELLNFDPRAMDTQLDELSAPHNEGEKLPVLTPEIIRGWQKALLDHRSLRALRKLLVAFRAAAHMNEENQVVAWSIQSSTVFSKLVTTALTYTPVVLAHHVPYKTFPDGRFKAPTQTPKMKALQKLILSYFHNIIHILGQLTESEMIKLGVNESAKILPYVIGSRRTVKMYLKTCLDLWSTADDSVRIASFLAIRRLAQAPDESILDLVLKSTYLQLVRSTKATSAHSLPSITLMKNSAAEIFCLSDTAAYQHAFGYIRQLAIHLRTSMKAKTKESYKQVHNWQFIHSVDFWSLVLARACDIRTPGAQVGEGSTLKPLIFPLIQVATGAVKLLNHARSYPFHLHLLRSLVHLAQHTDTYVPLLPHLLPPLTAVLTPSHKAKASTLRPLDFETSLRAPQQYIGTRVYIEGVSDEYILVLAEWLTTSAVHGSIAFPEITVPLTVILRKALKGAKGGNSGKEASAVKAFVERVEESVRWLETRRRGVPFALAQMDDVAAWEQELKNKLDESPLGKYLRVQRKAREKRKKLVEKGRKGEDEILDEH